MEVPRSSHLDSPAAVAWNEFLDNLKEAGSAVFAAPGLDAELDRAEGARFLSRLIPIGLELFFENVDPGHPQFSAIMSPIRKFGIDNPDTLYHYAPVDGSRTYRVTGNRGGTHHIAFTVYSGSVRNLTGGDLVSTASDDELAFEADGGFELLLSAEEPQGHAGNWLRLDPGLGTFAIRQYFLDRKADAPATYKIEVAGETSAPPPLTEERLTEGLRGASLFVRAVSSMIAGLPPRVTAERNVLRHFPGKAQGAMYAHPDNDYLIGFYRLGDDEALVIEGRPPEAPYWNLHLCNSWTESLDYENYTIGLNNSQVKYGDDGGFKLVVSATDPGAPNWIDTAGHAEGLLCFRWLRSADVPMPECKVVKLAEFS